MDKTFGHCARQAERCAAGAGADDACPRVSFTEARMSKCEARMRDSPRSAAQAVHNARARERPGHSADDMPGIAGGPPPARAPAHALVFHQRAGACVRWPRESGCAPPRPWPEWGSLAATACVVRLEDGSPRSGTVWCPGPGWPIRSGPRHGRGRGGGRGAAGGGRSGRAPGRRRRGSAGSGRPAMHADARIRAGVRGHRRASPRGR